MSWLEINPFPYLKPGQYSGLKGNGEITFLDPSIPEDKKKWLKEEYKKWWEENQKRTIEAEWE